MHLFHEGRFVGPFVYGYQMKLDLDTLRRDYVVDRQAVQPIRFFCRGEAYEFWGLFEASGRIVCPAEGGTLFLFGTDRLGRDIFSRILYGARISLTIGVLGVAVSFILGIIIGGLAGYYGGVFDTVTQRIIEVIQSLPHIPLWMALASIMPASWSPLVVYFGSRSSWACSTGPISRARCARSSCRCARRITCWPRSSWARGRRASWRSIWCRAS